METIAPGSRAATPYIAERSNWVGFIDSKYDIPMIGI